jgi:hypothetical protein
MQNPCGLEVDGIRYARRCEPPPLIRATDEYLKKRTLVASLPKCLSFAKLEYTQLEGVKGR